LSSVLTHAGYRVGRFTSPDLIDFRDRISVDAEWISEEEFAQQLDQILPLLADTQDPPTLFEVLTAVAFSHFAERKVDIAVIEVGLGGRYDATNVVQPMLTMLTTVGMDHTALLGNTIEKIAWEKVGIAKNDVPLLLGSLPAQAERVAHDECERVHAPLVTTSDIILQRSDFTWEYASYRVIAPFLPETVNIPLIASYQKENLLLVLAAIEELRKEGLAIPNDAISSGLAKTVWPGRFEVMNREPIIVLDGAHNPPGAEALAKEIETLFPLREKRHLLFGVLADKDYKLIAHTLFPLFSRVTLTRSHSPRALEPNHLATIAIELAVPSVETRSVIDGVSAARAGLNPDDALLIAGSLTIVREARPLLVNKPNAAS
ncbi:MAG: folylpolyglutamate synthase/dihydrofolate synthase family protein, partial [Candidatus Bipolaricaulota bacterium]|nr:folylpolyglutamate synthase/dihydrofolate synthase family protein [Candidatus Bipolaricaulota bacterium]